MKWIAAHFSSSQICPAEMILAQHIRVLRADPTLKAIFGGPNGVRIRLVPFGKVLDVGAVPTLYATLPEFNRQPGPGLFSEEVRVRDVIRFHVDQVAGEEPLDEAGMMTLASHIIGVVEEDPHLKFQTLTHGLVPLARRVDLEAINQANVSSPQGERVKDLFDIVIDFKYSVVVAPGLAQRLWPLVTVEE